MPKQKVKAELCEDRVPATAPNKCWSMDFLSDQSFDGRKIRVLSIVDNFTRLSPTLDVGNSYRGNDVVDTLERIASAHGRPKRVRVGQGPEFISKDLDLWASYHDVVLDFSRPAASGLLGRTGRWRCRKPSTSVKESNGRPSNIGACNTAISPPNIIPTDEANASLIHTATSAKCSCEGYLT